MKNLKIKISIAIINLALKVMPEEYRHKTFIVNMIYTGKIKADKK